MNTCCKYFAECPIFKGILKGNTMTTEHYKQNFCNAGPINWPTCKRFMVREKESICPSYLLPNSPGSVDEIIHEMKLRALLKR